MRRSSTRSKEGRDQVMANLYVTVVAKKSQ
jgi:hypothetical protein